LNFWGFKIKKKKGIGHKDIYAIIAIVAFIFVLSFALNVVRTTEAALNNVNPSSGMASLSLNKTDENNEFVEPILVKNGSTWQLRKLKIKFK